MTAHLEAATEILGEIRSALGDEQGPDVALDAIVPSLRRVFPLDRATIRRIDDEVLEIVAVWTSEPTALGIGAKMRALSSSLPAILQTGRPVVKSRMDPKAELLGQVVASEGIASFVTLPLRVKGRIMGLLSLSSSMPEAFADEDLPFLERIAEMVEARVAGSLSG